MRRELRFGVITIQNVPWPMLAERWQHLDELGFDSAPSDHDMTGVPYWDPPERASRLREFTEVVDRMLRNEETTYRGHHYRVKNANMRPAPVQRPRPPLTLAAWGPKTLRVAAEYADSWNFAPVNPELSPEQNLEETARRNRMLDDYCLELGRDPAGINRSLPVFPRASDAPFASDEPSTTSSESTGKSVSTSSSSTGGVNTRWSTVTIARW